MKTCENLRYLAELFLGSIQLYKIFEQGIKTPNVKVLFAGNRAGYELITRNAAKPERSKKYMTMKHNITSRRCHFRAG
jgi:hypothetical protein